jgi:hypothetical protein
VPKNPDRSYLADAIHLVDLIHRAGEEVSPAIAAVEQSKAAAITARLECRSISNGLTGTRNYTRKRSKDVNVV